MKKAVKQSTGSPGGSPNRKKWMAPAGGSPKKKQSAEASRYPRRGSRRALQSIENIMGQPESLEDAFKHGMCLRPRQRSISPESEQLKKKKKSSPPRRKKEYKPLIAEKESKCEESDEEEDVTVKRYLDGRDCTTKEYQICMKYLKRQDFEFLYPIPDCYKKLEMYLNQIRETRGYGLTISRPVPYEDEMYPLIDDYREKNPPRLVKYVDIITGALLDDMEKVFGKHYESLEVENLVYAQPNHAYFLTLRVEEEGSIHVLTRSGRKNGKTVEVLFYVKRGPIRENPHLGSDIQLIEWKLKQGGIIIHCTEEILTPLAAVDSLFSL